MTIEEEIEKAFDEALRRTKSDLDLAVETGGPLPWPFNRCGAIDIDGKQYPVINGRVVR